LRTTSFTKGSIATVFASSGWESALTTPSENADAPTLSRTRPTTTTISFSFANLFRGGLPDKALQFNGPGQPDAGGGDDPAQEHRKSRAKFSARNPA
jgi:hypothetical protein